VLGCGIGFAELQRAGEIKKLPRIFAAQPENCAPIARAFLKQPAVAAVPTIAEGTAIAQPIRTPEVMAVLHESQGGAVMLSEAEIAAATLDLARTGIYVEPTCAQAAAAFTKLLEAGTIRAEYGADIGENAVHGSDGPDTARTEIAFFFAESELQSR
jgi:threonine synthase